MEELIVDGSSCNDEMFTALNLSFLIKLKLLEVGDYSFAYVNEVKLIGLHALERMVVGKYSFKKSKEEDKSGYFYLKDCERLKELKIGCESFEDYSVCEISNLASLEVIEMGEWYEMSYNFMYASLELKSDGDRMK